MRLLRIASVVALASFSLIAGAEAAQTERIVVNRHTGLAIDGFDPVAFFTDAAALKGDPDVEAAQGGVVWRFRNPANREVFLAHPDIYGPQFGGYDPVDVARGKAVAGRAALWLVFGERLYLFSREANLTAFTADPSNVLQQAGRAWPTVVETLSAY